MSETPLQISRHDTILALEIVNPPINALSQPLRQVLLEQFEQVRNDVDIEGVILTTGGRNFIAGADIREFGKPLTQPFVPDLIAAIESINKPVVSVIRGACLGGGLEVALGTHYRIVHPESLMGFPEVHLGLLPGAGGTQRGPRVTGIRQALDLITTGRRIDGKEAHELGLADELVEFDDCVSAGLSGIQPFLDGTRQIQRVSERSVIPDPEAIAEYRSRLEKQVPHLYSPHRCVDAVENCTLPFAEGVKKERKIFFDCMDSPQRQGLIHAFFAERAVARIPESREAALPVKRVGVVGAGTMGAGIATTLLQNGYHVTMIEQNEEALHRGGATVFKNIDSGVKRGKLSVEEAERNKAENFVTSLDYAALAEVDLVIEAVFESMDVKQAVFESLDKHVRKDAVLATNTSYLDVNTIAGFTSRPDKVIGLHFFSPAHIMKLVEVVVGDASSESSIATGFAVARSLGKIAVRSGVCDGFIGNRIMMHYRKVADYLMLDGAAPDAIDRALQGFGFAMGPFAVGDLAGLDIGWASRKRQAPNRDPRERYVRVSDRLCENGWFGRKSGQGYYVYADGDAPTINPQALAILDEERAQACVETRFFSDQEIVDRYMTAMVNEACRILEEGIALRPIDVDAVKLFGYGFPRHHGGPLNWADQVGLDSLLDNNIRYAREDAYFWQTPALMQRLADNNETFASLNDR